MPSPSEITVIDRETDALEAIRARLQSLDTLWPVQWANRLASSTDVPTTATDAFIVESLIGGPTTPVSLPFGNPNGPLRQRSRQVQYLLHAPVDSGLDAVAQASAIEHVLQMSAITMADDEDDGPITVLIDSVLVRPTRPALPTLPHTTTPVLVAYRFYSV